MKLVTFRADGGSRIGVVNSDSRNSLARRINLRVDGEASIRVGSIQSDARTSASMSSSAANTSSSPSIEVSCRRRAQACWTADGARRLRARNRGC